MHSFVNSKTILEGVNMLLSFLSHHSFPLSPLHFGFPFLVEDPASGLPSVGETHQQYLDGLWHCISANVPSGLHSGINMVSASE